jgi:tetratricopeptide (TPR) repeat protein
LFEQAIEMDTEFALAHEGLAAVYGVISGYPVPEGHEPIENEDSYRMASEAAARALEIDPSLSTPHAVIGLIHMIKNEFGQAKREFDLAIELDEHDATAFLWYGIWSLSLGYVEGSLENLYRAQKLDPDTGIYNDFLGTALYLQGRREEGLEYLATALERGRSLGFQPFYLGLGTGGKLAAIAAVTPMLSDENSSRLVPYFMRIFDENGDRGKARRRFLIELDKSPEIAKTVYESVDFLILLGEYEKAVNVLGDAIGAAWVRIWWPNSHEFRQTPAFKTMLRNRNIDTFWRKHGWPDLCRPLGDDDFECD